MTIEVLKRILRNRCSLCRYHNGDQIRTDFTAYPWRTWNDRCWQLLHDSDHVTLIWESDIIKGMEGKR